MNRRSVLRAIVILSLFRSWSGEQLMSMETTTTPDAEMDALAHRLAQGQTGLLGEPFTFRWWLRGGEPGSPSEHLTIEGDRGSLRATYMRAGFDPSRNPPQYAETIKGVVHRDRASAILGDLFAGPVFRTTLPGEQEGDMRDGRKETWGFTDRKKEHSKTLHEPFPPGTDELRVLCRKTAEELVQTYRPG